MSKSRRSLREPRPVPPDSAALAERSEEELVVAYVAHDDQQAFRELYRRLSPLLLGFARRRLKSSDLACDLVQQAFTNAHVARRHFALGSRFRPWMIAILANLIRDHWRSVSRESQAEVDPDDLPELSTNDVFESRDDAARVRRAVESLLPRYARVIELHWIDERPFSEVAAELGEGLSTVKVRAHRAYRKLRRTLETAS